MLLLQSSTGHVTTILVAPFARTTAKCELDGFRRTIDADDVVIVEGAKCKNLMRNRAITGAADA